MTRARLVDAATELFALHGFQRTATEDIEIAGQVIQAGDGIIAHEPTANRDDSMFADADKFDIRRNTSGRVSEALWTLSVTEKSARNLPWLIETLE